MKCEFQVEGMHCAACELLVENRLLKAEGVSKVDAKLAEGKVYIEANKDLNPEELNKLIEDDGYKLIKNPSSSSGQVLNLRIKNEVNWNELGKAVVIAALIFAGFLLLQKLRVLEITNSDQINYPFVFFIGIIASLSTCAAVVGGIVLSLSSSFAKVFPEKKYGIMGMSIFHISRIITFFVAGGLLGVVGKLFEIGLVADFIIKVIIFIVMLILGLNLLDIFPFSKKLQIKMPKFLGKKVMKISDNHEHSIAQSAESMVSIYTLLISFATAAVLGFLTFVLPCGFTQSIQIIALTSGSFINGALIMFVFALGTLPVLALISFASVKLSKTLQSGLFFKTAGVLVLFFAFYNFLFALIAIGIITPIF